MEWWSGGVVEWWSGGDGSSGIGSRIMIVEKGCFGGLAWVSASTGSGRVARDNYDHREGGVFEIRG
jgi:hypothetical protein